MRKQLGLNPYTEAEWKALPAEERELLNLAWGYPNAGTDYRILGPKGGPVQDKLSTPDPRGPNLKVLSIGRFHVGVHSGPPGTFRPYFGIYIPTGKDRWFSFRIGARWDQNWINENGTGGYIADVILKPRMDHVVL